mgnify:CR=1 FL=1
MVVPTFYDRTAFFRLRLSNSWEQKIAAARRKEQIKMKHDIVIIGGGPAGLAAAAAARKPCSAFCAFVSDQDSGVTGKVNRYRLFL